MRTPLLFAPLALAAVVGCAPQHSSVEIFAICAPPVDAKLCAGAATCAKVLANSRLYFYTSLNTTAGVLTNSLVASIQFNNQNPRNGDTSAGRTNTNDAVIEKYRLSYPGSGLPDTDYAATATIPAGGAQSPLVVLIPPERADDLAAATVDGTERLVLVDLQAEGRYMDGTRFETGVFRIPVDVIDAPFAGGPACTTAGEVRFYCPNAGQTSSNSCAAP